jgi:hypothetical protein
MAGKPGQSALAMGKLAGAKQLEVKHSRLCSLCLGLGSGAASVQDRGLCVGFGALDPQHP